MRVKGSHGSGCEGKEVRGVGQNARQFDDSLTLSQTWMRMATMWGPSLRTSRYELKTSKAQHVDMPMMRLKAQELCKKRRAPTDDVPHTTPSHQRNLCYWWQVL